MAYLSGSSIKIQYHPCRDRVDKMSQSTEIPARLPLIFEVSKVRLKVILTGLSDWVASISWFTCVPRLWTYDLANVHVKSHSSQLRNAYAGSTHCWLSSYWNHKFLLPLRLYFWNIVRTQINIPVNSCRLSAVTFGFSWTYIAYYAALQCLTFCFPSQIISCLQLYCLTWLPCIIFLFSFDICSGKKLDLFYFLLKCTVHDADDFGPVNEV